jgi:phenylacetate-CoA ligase
VNVYPHLIENAIGAVPGIGSEYRIVVDRPQELDDLIVEVEAADPSLAASVRERVKASAGITPVVKVHLPNTLPTTEFKSARVTDLRRFPR